MAPGGMEVEAEGEGHSNLESPLGTPLSSPNRFQLIL